MERSCEPMNKNRIEGAAEQGERAMNREALVLKARRRRSGGCAAKECVVTRGDLAPSPRSSWARWIFWAQTDRPKAARTPRTVLLAKTYGKRIKGRNSP